VIAPLVEPCAVVVEALTVALVIVDDVEMVRVDLEAPASIPRPDVQPGQLSASICAVVVITLLAMRNRARACTA
jgi:hypothetical protein